MSTPQSPQRAAVVLDANRALARAEDLCRFIDCGPMPQLAAAECARRLTAAGYQELREEDAWSLTPGGCYHVIRAGTTVIAFRAGSRAPAEAGIRAFGAHLDSPNLRVKPHGMNVSEGYRRLAVEVYGGALLATWTDRDLGLAGRVVVQDGDGLRTELIRIDRPVARIPNLAIHLNRKVNDEGLRLDKQRHLPPVLGLAGGALGADDVRRVVAAAAGVAAESVVDFDLGLFDVTPSTLGGLDGEFVFAPRLDNLGSSHAGLVALVESAATPVPAHTSLIALYDHEECGSASAQGAGGPFLLDVLRRIATTHEAASCGPPSEEEARALARSFLISADMAHAVHPNYGEMHEPEHKPRLNRGPVIKRNENQRYATDGVTGARFTGLCRAAGFEPQVFVTRTDLPCGSTIGPITAARAGVATVDVGNAMLSMHSIREMAGTFDQDLMIEALLRHLR